MPLSQELPESLRASRAVEVLERSISKGRLAHAILLHGNTIPELEAIARMISSALLQTERDPMTHPDCFTLRPSGKARLVRIGKNGEHNTMRQLIGNLQKSSHQGGAKVGILFEADRMNTQSANAFLKTLEEPTPGTTLLLLTTRPYDLLDTIRSRCLNFRVPGQAKTIKHADWSQWSADYREWIGHILKAADSVGVAHITLGAYGLNLRLQKILDAITAETWEKERERLPDTISSEEKEASQASLLRHQRARLFAAISTLNTNYARDIELLNPGRLPVTALSRAQQALEHSLGLLTLNMNQSAAIECFLLNSMRIWRSLKQ